MPTRPQPTLRSGTSSLLSTSDVARLARVQRPVVSMWRRRYVDGPAPFPSTVGSSEAGMLFSADDIAGWLTLTGLGNNASARDDLALFTPLPTSEGAFSACTSLLTVLALGHDLPESVEGLSRLAHKLDNDDDMLMRELLRIRDEDFDILAADASARVEAAWGPAEALEALVQSRSRLASAGVPADPLSPLAVLTLADVICGVGAAIGASIVVDSTGLLDDVALAVVAEPSQLQVSVGSDGPVARLTRQRLSAHDRLADDPVGGYGHANTVVTSRMPTAKADAARSLADVVRRLDDQPRGATMIVIGPSSVLLEGLRDPVADAYRADLVRDTRLRVAVRLPRGLVVASPRQQLAVLIFSSIADVGRARASGVTDDASARGTVPQDLVFTADLEGVRLAPEARESLVDDIAAALSPHSVRAHAFSFGRMVPRPELVARTSGLVPAAEAAARRMPTGPVRDINVERAAELADRARTLGGRIADVATALEPTPVFSPRPRLVLDALVSDGVVRMYPGAVVDASDVVDTGVPLVSAGDVRQGGPKGDRALPVLVQQGAYRRTPLTEPGDVIITTKPSAAWIDRRGRSLVEAPARILRLVDGLRVGVTPELLAGAVNSVDNAAATWRRWIVSPAPPGQRDHLGEALASLHDRRLALRHQLDQLESIQQSLTDGVRDGGLSFPRTTSITDPEGGA